MLVALRDPHLVPLRVEMSTDGDENGHHMLALNAIFGVLKDWTPSLKTQLALLATCIIALLWGEASIDPQVTLAIKLTLWFSLLLAMISVFDLGREFLGQRRDQATQRLIAKMGVLPTSRFTDRLDTLWCDRQFHGLGWEVLIDMPVSKVFLAQPCCLECKSDFITRVNPQRDGVYLHCNQCKTAINVDDVGVTRAIAEARLHGHVRRFPEKYFYFY